MKLDILISQSFKKAWEAWKSRRAQTVSILVFLVCLSSPLLASSLRDWISGASRWENPASISQIPAEDQELISKSLQDLPGIIDSHFHLVCREEKNGCYLPSKLFSPRSHPILNAKTQILMSALGIQEDSKPDSQIAKRIRELVSKHPYKPYIAMVFAYTASYDPISQERDLEKTGLEVPNSYMQSFLKESPGSFIPVYSLHPFQKDLEKAFGDLKEPRFFKVIPNSMHFSPSDERCLKFFELLSKHDAVLITHVGIEHSVEGGGIQDEYGNPLLYERWLKQFPKLRIIFAHAGGAGQSFVDEKKKEDNFKLVLQLLRKYPRQTYADISAFSVAPNLVSHLPELLQDSELHSRLLYGSDYPVVAIRPLLSLTLYMMYGYGLLGSWEQFRKHYNVIMNVYRYNPLLASVLTMRWISWKGQHFASGVFFENARHLIGIDFDFSRTLQGAPP